MVCTGKVDCGYPEGYGGRPRIIGFPDNPIITTTNAEVSDLFNEELEAFYKLFKIYNQKNYTYIDRLIGQNDYAMEVLIDLQSYYDRYFSFDKTVIEWLEVIAGVNNGS